MSHCPWTYRAVSISGNSIIPCCKFQGNITIKTDLDTEYKTGELVSIRQRLDSGEKIHECQECWVDEELGQESLRQQGLEMWGTVTEPEIRYVEYDLDNTCNLKCVSCSSNNSSALLEDEKKIHGASAFLGRTVTDHYKQIDLSKLETVKFFGGEPLLSKNINNLCKDLIEFENLSRLTVYTNTNVTMLPKPEVEKVFLECQDLVLSLSIDGLGDLHNFIRHGVDWNVICKNFKYFDSLIDQRKGKRTRIFIHTTVYIYNVTNLHLIRDWFKEHYPRFVFDIEPLFRPKFLSIMCMPQDLKLVTIEYLKKHGFDSLINYLETNSDNLFDYFVTVHRRLVNLRNIDFEKINPELHRYIEQYPAKPVSDKRLLELRIGYD